MQGLIDGYNMQVFQDLMGILVCNAQVLLLCGTYMQY